MREKDLEKKLSTNALIKSSGHFYKGLKIKWIEFTEQNFPECFQDEGPDYTRKYVNHLSLDSQTSSYFYSWLIESFGQL